MLSTNNTNQNPIMPLLFLNAKPEEINPDYLDRMSFIYDEEKQIPIYECGGGSENRQIGTRCLKYETTHKKNYSGSFSDPKNSIDDAKSAK